MKLFRRLLFLVLIVILLIVIFQNQESLGQTFDFRFLSWTFSLILGFWILFAFVTGAATFALIDAWKGLWMRLEIRKRDQEIARLEKELLISKANAAAPRPLSGDSTPE